MKRAILFYSLLILSFYSFGQQLTQTIRGTVIDKDSKSPLPGANVVLIGSNPIVGTSTDVNGTFKLEKIQVGRHSLRISFLGFKEITVSDLVLNSTKELVITVEMEESVIQASTITVVAEQQKDQPLNEMSTVSARTFTIEETNRYAGSWGDPSRMVANFAGVTSGNDQRNDIVVRGNSPIGVLWKLEGMDISSPNHFSTNGASGGAISILNNNTLENSDFMTGAFAAEYGNATSGVFDLRLRKGNNEKREYLVQFGAAGFELGAEGPFIKGKKSSYLINYRYSAFGLLGQLGFFDFVGAIPYYQDLSCKLFFPYSKGNISIFAIGGKSHLTLGPEKDTTKWKDDYFLMRKRKPVSKMQASGITWMHFVGKQSFIKLGVVSNYAQTIYFEDSADYSYHYTRMFYSDFAEGSYKASLVFNSKLNSRNTIKTGVSADYLYFDFLTERHIYPQDTVYTIIDFTGNSNMMQAFAQWKYKILENLSLNTGVHETYYFLNQKNAIEPRAGLKFDLSKRQSLSAGFGMHSKILPNGVYFSNVRNSDGTFSRSNKNLDYIRATHYVLGYDNQLQTSLRLKSEIYYQVIGAAPVRRDSATFFSGLNTGADYENITNTQPLISNGTGTNYGIELTFEKFYSLGYYFLITGSVFDSKYKGSDGIERNTAFNSNYAFNVLGGKEFKVGKAKNNVLAFSVTWALIGGRREVPILVDSSRIAETAVYDYSNAYEKKIPDYMRLDGRISYRVNRKKVSHELALDVRNMLNRKNVFLSYYDSVINDVVYQYQVGFFPVLFYKIEF